MQCCDAAAVPLELQPIWLCYGPQPNDKDFSIADAYAKAGVRQLSWLLSALGCIPLHKKALYAERCLLILTR